MIYDRICIMVPTYKRVKNGKLIMLIRSVQETCKNIKQICFSFCVNQDDEETLNWLSGPAKEIIKADFDWVVTEETERPHLGKYWNQIYNETKFNDEKTLVSMIGDDMEFLTDGWDDLILDTMNSVNGIGVLYGSDVYSHKEEASVNLFITRLVISATKHPFMSEKYRADVIDVIWYQFAKQVGILYYLPSLLIKHNHVMIVGGKDENSKRLQIQQCIYRDKVGEIGDEVNEMVNSFRENEISKETTDTSLAVMMCVCDRIKLLNKTMESFSRTKIKPPKLFIFDDLSDELVEIKQCIEKKLSSNINPSWGMSAWEPKIIPKCEYEIIEGNKKAGKEKQIEGIDNLFDKGYDKVFVIDSDSLFWSRWYQVLRLILWQQRDAGLALFSLFNLAHGHEFGKTWKPTMLPTKAIGGFAMLIYRDTWMKFRESEEYSGKQYKGKEWDVRLYTFCLKNNMKMACTTPTYIQHIGYLEGTHASTDSKSLAAIDFLGDPGFKEKPAKQVANVNRIGISFTGGVEEAVCASIWVNWLTEQGYVVECYTIPYFETLVRCICPTGRIRVNMQIQKNRNWIEANTDTMKVALTHCSVVANVQTRSRENMSDFNMWKDVTVFDFVTNRIIESCGIPEIPKIDFKNYLKYDKRQFLQSYNCEEGMKIVSSAGIDGGIDKNIGLNGAIEAPMKMTFPQLIGFMLGADEYAGGCGDVAWAAVFNPKCKITVYGRDMRYLKSIKQIRSDAEVIKI